MEKSPADNDHIGNNHVTGTKIEVFKRNKLQFQYHSLNLVLKKSNFFQLPAFSASPRAYNATASLEKLTSTDYVVLGKRQDEFERLYWSKSDSNYFDVKLKVFKKDVKKFPTGTKPYKRRTF